MRVWELRGWRLFWFLIAMLIAVIALDVVWWRLFIGVFATVASWEILDGEWG